MRELREFCPQKAVCKMMQIESDKNFGDKVSLSDEKGESNSFIPQIAREE